MRIKTKVTLGVGFLFLLIVMVSGIGIFYLNKLSSDSQNILVDNYESLEFMKTILQGCDSLEGNALSALATIEKNIRQQEENITEGGEIDITLKLRSAFERLKNEGLNTSSVQDIRESALAIQDLNMKAIVKKNAVSQNTAAKARTYLIIIGTICVLAAFTFVVNFPGYVANPIVQLTNGIKAITEKNYEERLDFDRQDEFQELSEAFNQMAEKMDEYEHSNLAKIIFEKKRIETIINRMTDPVIGLDENQSVVFANDRSLELLNLTHNDVMDKYAPDIAVNNDLFRSLIKRTEKNERTSLIKAVVNGKENYFSRETILISYIPTGEKDTVQIGEVILLKNITSYKELDQAKTNFIATISHELKTPIATIQMCAKLLQDSRVGTLNEEQKNITETLTDEVTRLTKITNELLDLSQVETGNIKLSIKKTNPKDIIQLATEAVKFQAERKQVKIDVKVEKDLPELLADIDKTTWVLVNFLTNAIRYSPENDDILLACERADGHIKFSVEDHGPGIDSQYLPRIFEKFFQVPGTPSGTGLGLAISKEFIEAQGGWVNVTSQAGRGSIFEFMLNKIDNS